MTQRNMNSKETDELTKLRETNSINEISRKSIETALDFATEHILIILPEFTTQFQNAYSENNFYRPIPNDYWTTGFWTGEIWLAYEYSRNEQLRQAAEIQVDSFLYRIDHKIEVDHHDMGFLYSPSCVAAYKLTGSTTGKEAGIKAADQLMTRFHPIGEFIQAWGPMNASENYRLIIDCLLNVPLLFWATQETGDQTYKIVAEKHIRTALKHVIREDYSTWHTYFFDMVTGDGDHGETCQGYKNDSAWARGQAWGIYGCALAYKYTQDERYLVLFEHVTKYYIDRLPMDLVPYWDLTFVEGDTEPRDSSSASIAACGMLEMAKYLEPDLQEYYLKLARKIMHSVVANYAVKNHTESNGLVLHSTYSNRSPYNTCNHYGVDECNSWGDYFYMEALMRLYTDWKPYW